jgi:hypothetical protein
MRKRAIHLGHGGTGPTEPAMVWHGGSPTGGEEASAVPQVGFDNNFLRQKPPKKMARFEGINAEFHAKFLGFVKNTVNSRENFEYK